MLQEKRQEQILEELKENDSVRIADLSKNLGVTRETVRKDLYELEKRGLIKKVHGGAVLTKTNIEPSYAKRSATNISEKEAIARKAADFVEDGDTLFIDLGTTTLLLAKFLHAKKNITVITNALLVAFELANHPDAKVILSGGELRNGELSLSGPIATKSIADLYIDKAFIGVGGIAVDSGFTDYHIGESEVRKAMLKNAREKYVLADHSKMNVTAFTKVAAMSEVDAVITDSLSSRSVLQSLTESGLEVVIADV